VRRIDPLDAVCKGSRCRIFEEIVKMVSGFWSSLPLASISLSSVSFGYY